MYFSRSFLVALLSAPFLAFAQTSDGPNPFKIPSSGLMATAGKSTTLMWQPTTQGTVSLYLRSGANSDLDKGTAIATSIPNSGSYTWSVPSSVTRGSDYTIEIVSDSDSSAVNYTPQFVLDSSNTVASTTNPVSSGTSMVTSSPSAFPLPSGVTINTSAPSSASSGSSSSQDNLSTATTLAPLGSSSMSMGSSMAMSSSTADSSESSASNAAVSTGPATQTGSAARVTAAAGALGAIALGAFAL